MHRLRLFAVAIVLVIPLSSMAAAVPYDGSPFAHVNPLDFSNASNAVSVPVSQSAAADAPAQKDNVGSKDICYDETVYESNSEPVKDPTKGPKFSDCEKLKGDCSNAEKAKLAGYTTYTDDYAKSKTRIQRCTKAPASLPTGTSGAGGASSLITKDSLRTINPESIQDKVQMSNMLQTLGASSADADAAVANKPQETLSLLNQVADGNTSAATQPLAEELHLNPDLIKSQGQIESDTPASTNGDYGGGGDKASSSSACGYTGVADKLMLSESGCGKNNGSGTYQGPLQFSCDSWAGYANATGNSQYADCKYRMDPQIASDVSNQYYDKMESKYGTQCQNAGVSWNSCAMAIHAWGEGGFQKMLGSVQANPDASALDWCGGSSCANKAYLNTYNPDGTVKGAFSSLDQFMSCGWSCNSQGVTTPGKYLGDTTAVGSVTSGPVISKVVTDTSAVTDIGAVAAGKSPNPTYRTTTDNSSGFGSNNQMLMAMMLMGPLSKMMQGFGSTAANAATPVSQIQQTPPPPPATLSITATPTTLAHGASISLSWTSDATLINPPCQVTQNGTVIAQGNGGTKTIPTATTTPPSISFVLMCKQALDGQTLQQSTTVTVQ